MTFRTPARLAVLGLAATLAIGCDEQKTPTAEPAANTATGAPGATGDATMPPTMANAQNQAADLQKAAGAKMDETAAAADATAKEAGAKASEAGDTMVAQAQKLYADAQAAIQKMDVNAAQKYMDQLSALKAKLPADWQEKVTALEQQFATLKSKAGAVQMPKLGQ